jgi:hypothetical protein
MYSYLYPSGAPVPLELILWPSGIGGNGMALVAAIASLIVVGIALRGVRQHASRALQILSPAKRPRMVRQTA